MMEIQENGKGGNKYRRMDSVIIHEDGFDLANGGIDQQDRTKNTKRYVIACAVFASLNSVLLGYGRYI